MRQAKKLGILGLVLGLVAALGLIAGGSRVVQAQTVNTCAGTAVCTFSLATTVAPGGTLTTTMAEAPVPGTGVASVRTGPLVKNFPTTADLSCSDDPSQPLAVDLTAVATCTVTLMNTFVDAGAGTRADSIGIPSLSAVETGAVSAAAGAPGPVTDGLAKVRITSASGVALLGCAPTPFSDAPAAGLCFVLNNGQEVDVPCGVTAGATPPVPGPSTTCMSFDFTIASSFASCLANPIPAPLGGCPAGANLSGSAVPLQITWIATPGNGGATGGLNLLPGAVISFGGPSTSALVVSASPYSIPSNGTIATVITATFACTGPLATPAAFLAPGGLKLVGAEPSTLCGAGLPGSFNFISPGPILFDNGRQFESIGCGFGNSQNIFGGGTAAPIRQTSPLVYSCTGAAVVAVATGRAGAVPVNVTYQSAVGGLSAIGSTLINVVAAPTPKISIACNPDTIAAGGLGAICIATVTDLNGVPLSGLTGVTVTFTTSDTAGTVLLPCLVNIPSATINVTTSPKTLPQVLPGGPCVTPSTSAAGQVNTFVNGRAAAALVASGSTSPEPVVVSASLGVVVPPSAACGVAPYLTGIPAVSPPVAQNVPALGTPAVTGCGSAFPVGTSGLAVAANLATGGLSVPIQLGLLNSTSASTVVQVGAPVGILIAGSTPTVPLQLTRGCNQVIVTAATATPIASIAARANPQGPVVSIWRFNNTTKQYQAGWFADTTAPTDFVATGGQTTAMSGGGNQITNNGQQITETYFVCVNRSTTMTSG